MKMNKKNNLMKRRRSSYLNSRFACQWLNESVCYRCIIQLDQSGMAVKDNDRDLKITPVGHRLEFFCIVPNL